MASTGLRGLGEPARWPSFLRLKGVPLNYQQAAASVVAALNDADRTLIGDPRKKEYKVAVQFPQVKEAFEFARHLARLRIIPSTTIVHDKMFGEPVGALVNIYGKEDQRNLLNVGRSKLDKSRRRQLDDLVLARSPIPEDILERIAKARERGWSPHRTAEKMNGQGIIAGMGGVRWTAKKVRDALAKNDERVAQHQEAA